MNNYNEIKNKINEVSVRINNYEEQYIKSLKEELNNLKEHLKEICPHNNITYKPDVIFSEYCERSTCIPDSIECHDCGLYVDSSGNNKRYYEPKIRIIFSKYRT